MKQYVVDAFTDKLFGGNPAAICVMDEWLPDEMMINIARENNLSETAFTVKEDGNYRLRWFTPGGEIDLCGHATLACAFVLMTEIDSTMKKVTFATMSGELIVEKHGDLYEMDFPAYQLEPVEVSQEMADAIGAEPTEAYMGRDLLCIFKDESVIEELNPDIDKVNKLDGLLLQTTAKGAAEDCVSRTFGLKLGIREDPVCGSGHCHIVPYWAEKLGKSEITARQASDRGGMLYCRLAGDRVKLSGKAVIYSEADIKI